VLDHSIADISVVIPAYNEQSNLASTVQSFSSARTAGTRIEFVIVDDASTDDTVANLISALPRLLKLAQIDIRMERLPRRIGSFQARNFGASVASANVLLMTDAHVQIREGWDDIILRRIRDDVILAGTTCEEAPRFRSYGESLSLPQMATCWNAFQPSGRAVPVAPCRCTAFTKRLFDKLDGYDNGMKSIGSGDAEFSIRAWLSGKRIVAPSDLEVVHRRKGEREMRLRLQQLGVTVVHDILRLSALYLNENQLENVIDYYRTNFPDFLVDALAEIDGTELENRRQWLRAKLQRKFDWFSGYFEIEDRTRIGQPASDSQVEAQHAAA
jgi:glycosyltransferase involved in cell wall biosynthesis